MMDELIFALHSLQEDKPHCLTIQWNSTCTSFACHWNICTGIYENIMNKSILKSTTTTDLFPVSTTGVGSFTEMSSQRIFLLKWESGCLYYRNLTVIIWFCVVHILTKNVAYNFQQNVLKLGDFGSCRSVYSKPPHTEYISTRWYRAPECLLTDGYYSLKMDIWSAGCVFFEIMRYLCGGRGHLICNT